MLKLMNSAMMPREGLYSCKKISKGEFKSFFEKAGKFESYIGYPNACKILSELTGINIPISRETTDIRFGDLVLAMRLRYRIDPAEKATRKHGDSVEDYDFYEVHFFGNEDFEIVEKEFQG